MDFKGLERLGDGDKAGNMVVRTETFSKDGEIGKVKYFQATFYMLREMRRNKGQRRNFWVKLWRVSLTARLGPYTELLRPSWVMHVGRLVTWAEQEAASRKVNGKAAGTGCWRAIPH